MSNKTKTPSDAVTSRGGKATKNQQCAASFRHGNSITKKPFLCRGQLTFLFDSSLPNPQDIARFKNQRTTIINYLLDGKTLTQDTSRYLFGVMRLASRVSELRAAGWNINRRMIAAGENGARVAEYWIEVGRSRLEAYDV